MRMRIWGLALVMVMEVAGAGCSKSTRTEKSEEPTAVAAPADARASTTSPGNGAAGSNGTTGNGAGSLRGAANRGGDTSSGTASVEGRAVKAEMRNVMFHLTDTSTVHLVSVSGELWPTGKNEMPVFDDASSFEVRVTNGTISITPEALANVLNGYVFAGKNAPLKDIAIAIKKDQLLIKGKLHSKGDIPFQTAGTMSATGDGRVRIHTEQVKALHIPVKGMMGLFGIDLTNLVNSSKIPGMETEKNDVVMDLGILFPPPHIRGKVTEVRVESNRIVTVFGDGGKAVKAGSNEESNYMTFQGNRVQIGKLTMENTDLTVVSLEKRGPLDWDQGHYKEQLIEGYTKMTKAYGLRAYVKAFGKLGKDGEGR